MKDRIYYILFFFLGFPIAANYTALNLSFYIQAFGPQWSSFVLKRNWFAWYKDKIRELLIMMKDGLQK